MKLVLAGFAGAGTIEFGGYDYHDGTRATGEGKDEIAGQAIGAALQYAAALNSPLVIYLISDGSLSSDGVIDNSADGAGKPVWRGDNSDVSSTVMLVFDPDGRPAMTAGGQPGRALPRVGLGRDGELADRRQRAPRSPRRSCSTTSRCTARSGASRRCCRARRSVERRGARSAHRVRGAAALRRL